ncbi:hypothetical protein Bca52824_072528 [Brassica carinata]|uniref:Uncharacterized protein n=1 Tax=Brassica carinata TaxID=52824 RepID=A0A8X7QDL6_BRACI|nr:hypothetical protein Bca52824_072528 [Brassica carinata]
MYITNYRSPIARILKRKKRRNQSEVSLPVDFDRAQRDYWCQVRQSEAFDIGNASIPSNMCGMITGLFPIDCIRERGYPYHVLVNLYAKVGLHRYNMLKVTKKSLLKFNMLQNLMSSFYMTLLVQVDEQNINHLEFTCFIARLRDEVITKKPLIPHFHGDAVDDGFFKGELPDWPSDDALNDGKRFYSVKKSEWQANYWISMYLELGRLSQLEILEVAIETGVENVEPPNERLKAKLQGITKTNIHLVTPCTYKPPEKLQKDILHKKMKT